MRYIGYDDEKEYTFTKDDMPLLKKKLYMDKDDEILKLFREEG
jgi:hypothetical protein